MAYLPALRGSFVFDDDLYVTQNRALHSLDGLRAIWLEPAASTQYYPLVFTTYWLEYHLWGLNPFGYHAVNVLLHAINAVLVWVLVQRLQIRGAWLAAALFALHPVHVESVAWITERKDVLSGMFYLLTALVWLRFVERRRWPDYVAALALFLCALLSKSMTCTLPLTLLLLAWWRGRQALSWMVVKLLPLFALGVGVGLLTAWRENLFPGAPHTAALPLLDRLLVASHALWFYAVKLVWPAPLMALYPRWQIHTPSSYAFLAGALLVPALLWVLRPRLGVAPLVALVCFAITLSPALGFLHFDFQRLSYVADRFQYLASLSLLALFAAALARLAERVRSAPRWTLDASAAGLLALLALLTWRHATVYADEERLWRDNVAKNPDAAAAHYNLGKVLLDQGRLSEAIPQFATAVQLEPAYSEAHLNWGVAADRSDDLERAEAQYRAAIASDPANAHAHNNLATLLFRLGKVDEAFAHFGTAVRMEPTYAEAERNWGLALAMQNRLDEAAEHYRAALRIDPADAEARQALQRLAAAPHAAPPR